MCHNSGWWRIALGNVHRLRLCHKSHCQVSLCLATSHDASRSTERRKGAVSPAQSVLTSCFATRGSGVQIPPAPLNPLIRAVSGRPTARWIHDPEVSRSTGGPQDSGFEAPHSLRGGQRGMARILKVVGRGEWRALGWCPRITRERMSTLHARPGRVETTSLKSNPEGRAVLDEA